MTSIKKSMAWAALRGDVYAHYSYNESSVRYFSGKINGKIVDFNYSECNGQIELNGSGNVSGILYGTIDEMQEALA